jgi:hypothetical protein
MKRNEHGHVHGSWLKMKDLLYKRSTLLFQSLNNCFNVCLYKPSKFRPEIKRDVDEDEEKIMKDFIEKLHSYNLFTLQSRIHNKLLMFAHSIKTNGRAPVDLRSQINLPAPENDLDKDLEQTVNVYNLRRGRTLVKNIIPETKHYKFCGELRI